jgi:perosamine synthetase
MEKLKGKGKVIVPAVISPSVPSTVLYSGYDPVFCDINRYDFNMDTDSLKEVIENCDDVKGILAVHLYGQPSDMDKILKIAKKYDLFVVEDAAQALGGEYKNRKLGSLGDASILSFGHTKIIDRAQGGAVLTNRDDICHLVKKELEKIPPYSKDVENRKTLYITIYL